MKDKNINLNKELDLDKGLASNRKLTSNKDMISTKDIREVLDCVAEKYASKMDFIEQQQNRIVSFFRFETITPQVADELELKLKKMKEKLAVDIAEVLVKQRDNKLDNELEEEWILPVHVEGFVDNEEYLYLVDHLYQNYIHAVLQELLEIVSYYRQICSEEFFIEVSNMKLNDDLKVMDNVSMENNQKVKKKQINKK